MARQGRIFEVKKTQGSSKITGILRPVSTTGSAAGADIYYTAPATLELSINDLVEYKLGKELKPTDAETRRQVVVTKIVKKS